MKSLEPSDRLNEVISLRKNRGHTIILEFCLMYRYKKIPRNKQKVHQWPVTFFPLSQSGGLIYVRGIQPITDGNRISKFRCLYSVAILYLSTRLSSCVPF